MSTILSPQNAWALSDNFSDPFLKGLSRYLSLREGVSQTVYNDHKGKATVGVGHLVLSSDNLKLGNTISIQRVLDLFIADVARLRIREAVNISSWGMAQKIAVAGFCWVHGTGQFMPGLTRRMLQDSRTTATEMQAYMKVNWDRYDARNQERNRADIELFFPTVLNGRKVYKSEHTSGNFYFDNGNCYYSKVAWLASSPGQTGGGGNVVPLGVGAGASAGTVSHPAIKPSLLIAGAVALLLMLRA